MSLELLEGLFDRDEILSVVVFFENLLVEVVIYNALQYVWIIVRIDLPSRSIERGRVLAQEFDILLRIVPCLVDVLGAFVCPRGEFFGFVFNLLVQSF